MDLPELVTNHWAAENSPTGSGYTGMPLSYYLCPRCGARPAMVDEDSVWQGGRVGMLCIECGFGTKPSKGAVMAVKKWNKSVEQYVSDMTKEEEGTE